MTSFTEKPEDLEQWLVFILLIAVVILKAIFQ